MIVIDIDSNWATTADLQPGNVQRFWGHFHIVVPKPKGRSTDNLQYRTALLEGVLRDGKVPITRVDRETHVLLKPHCESSALYWLTLCKVDVSADITLGPVWDMAMSGEQQSFLEQDVMRS